MPIDIRVAHLFAALTDDQLRQVLETSTSLSLQEGQCMFESGEKAERFFLVVQGQIKLFRLSADGNEKIIDIIQPGNTFAEALMFMQHPAYPVSAAALSRAHVMSFDNRRFLRILRESPDTCFRVMGTMSQRLRGLIKEIDDLTLQSATTRMCAMLLHRMDEVGESQFTLPAAKGVLASRLSMKPETFSRIFQNLVSQGVIETSANRVSVLKPGKLRDLAHTESIIGLEPEIVSQAPCPLTGPKPL
jgi:CRP-like cAMP-binding protein